MNTAIILAGGLGTRLRSEITNIPKPMAPVQGKPFLELLINNCIDQGIQNFILSVGYLSHVIKNHFGEKWFGCNIQYSVEEVPLGTGGGILKASKLVNNLNSPCLILNGDSFFDINYQKMLAFHLNKNAQISLSLFESQDTERYMGIELDVKQKIISLNSNLKSPWCMVNGGVYLADPTTLIKLSSYATKFQSWESDILPMFLRQNGDIYGCLFSNTNFIDIGIPADYQKAQNLSFLSGSKHV